MRERTISRTSVGGESLHVWVWEPDGDPVGALLIAHGLGEHCGRYAHVAAHFVSKGFAVYGQDHVGFGRSGGRRGDVPSLDATIRDLLGLQDEVRRALGPDTRQVLLGHSMGGLIALTLLHDHPAAFREAVITGPALNVTHGVNPVLIGLSKVLGVVLPFVTLDNGLNPDEICSDKAVVKAYVDDPLVHRKISSRLFGGMVAACRRLHATPEAFADELALLLMHGEGDPICRAVDTERFYGLLTMKKKRLEIWPGMLHEVLNEPGQDRVLAECDAFLGL